MEGKEWQTRTKDWVGIHKMDIMHQFVIDDNSRIHHYEVTLTLSWGDVVIVVKQPPRIPTAVFISKHHQTIAT